MNQNITSQLAPLFYPRSVALVGISRTAVVGVISHSGFLAHSNVPVYPEPTRAAYALAKLTEYSEFLRSIQD